MAHPSVRSFVGVISLTAAALVSAETGSLLVQAHWPGVSTVWQRGSTYLASAPTDAGLRHAKAQGITTVINLTEPGELKPREQSGKDWFAYWRDYVLGGFKDWDEGSAVRSRGMRYEQIPIAVEAPDEAAAARFLAIVKEVDAKNLLIHCDAAGRALAMYAIYLGTVEGYSPEGALAVAEAAGLQHEGLKQFVLAYLRKDPTRG